IPVGMDSDTLNDVARLMWLFPLYGSIIGLLSGLVGLALSLLKAPSLVWATVTYTTLLVLTGFNHMDGLLDFADAVVAPTSKERRLQIMKDQYTGAAAVAIGLAVALITISSLSSIPEGLILSSIIVGETIAKLGMVIAVFMGPPARSGLGELFITRFREGDGFMKLTLSILMSLAISLVLGIVGLIACIIGALSSIVIVIVSRGRFGGLTGDVLGAINEITRGIALLAIAVSLSWRLPVW
ncbi:MAG: adenosylcobinamide-GDP ribazoletransferase, partial [Candidatus Nezhaarchaeales archaeon]